jgi:hypothetical protein
VPAVVRAPAISILATTRRCKTNGTLPAPARLDWICVSPKVRTDVVHHLGLIGWPGTFNFLGLGLGRALFGGIEVALAPGQQR